MITRRQFCAVLAAVALAPFGCQQAGTEPKHPTNIRYEKVFIVNEHPTMGIKLSGESI